MKTCHSEPDRQTLATQDRQTVVATTTTATATATCQLQGTTNMPRGYPLRKRCCCQLHIYPKTLSAAAFFSHKAQCRERGLPFRTEEEYNAEVGAVDSDAGDSSSDESEAASAISEQEMRPIDLPRRIRQRGRRMRGHSVPAHGSESDENRHYSDQSQDVIDGIRYCSESESDLDGLIGQISESTDDASVSSSSTESESESESEPQLEPENTHDSLHYLINMDDDVLVNGRAHVSRELQCAVKFMQWQACGTASIRQYDKMREVLRESHINIPSIKSTKNKLFKRLGFKAEKIACCPDLHIAYTGRYRHARKCKVCKKPRFDDRMASDEEYPDQASDSDSSQESSRCPARDANRVVSASIPNDCV